jgi:hypothetical protein
MCTCLVCGVWRVLGCASVHAQLLVRTAAGAATPVHVPRDATVADAVVCSCSVLLPGMDPAGCRLLYAGTLLAADAPVTGFDTESALILLRPSSTAGARDAGVPPAAPAAGTKPTGVAPPHSDRLAGDVWGVGAGSSAGSRAGAAALFADTDRAVVDKLLGGGLGARGEAGGKLAEDIPAAAGAYHFVDSGHERLMVSRAGQVWWVLPRAR